jgi:hypothetical protein
MPANRSTFLSLSLCLAALSGCALFYTPPVSPGPDTAVLRAGNWGGVYRGGRVSIERVNGTAPRFTDTQNMVLPPGEQQGDFEVLLCRNGQMQCRPLARAAVAFRVDGGRSYVVHAKETVNGSDRFTVWVEDAQSGAIAGAVTP